MAQLVKLVKYLPCENQDLSLVPRVQVKKPLVVVWIEEAETGGSLAQYQPA